MSYRRLPPLRSLEAFFRVVRLGSSRAAADELGLSPSALSRRVSALEEFLGKKLFTRAHQAMKLTDDGQAFFDAVMPHFEALALAVEGESDNLSLMRLRLGVLPLFASQRLFPRLPELRKMHPRLHIDVDTGPHLADRVGDTLDGAIVLTTQPDPHWHSIQLDQNMIYAFASRELVEEIGEEPDAQTLSRQTFLLHNTMSASLGAWSQAIGLDGFEPTAIDHFDSGQLMVEAAAQGLGIAIMHDDHYTRASDKRLARIYPREIASPNSYFFICQPRALEQKPLRLFHDWLVTAEL